MDQHSVLWRQELAAREHMLDHGQFGPPTPSLVGASTPADSHRPSMNGAKPGRPSMPDHTDLSKPSMIRGGSSGESPSMSALEVEEEHEIEKGKKPDPPSINGLAHPHSLSAPLRDNPKLAALRTTGLPKSATLPPTPASAPPILVDPRCSGYFVEAVCPYYPSYHFFLDPWY